MKRHWIEYWHCEPMLPMTFWVHHSVRRHGPWIDATEFDPPRQPPVPGKGYPIFHVEFNGFTFMFASLAEIRECTRVLGTKALPSTLNLSRERGTSVGPNSHWLSRMLARTKAWRYRKEAVAYLNKSLPHFEKAIASG